MDSDYEQMRERAEKAEKRALAAEAWVEELKAWNISANQTVRDMADRALAAEDTVRALQANFDEERAALERITERCLAAEAEVEKLADQLRASRWARDRAEAARDEAREALREWVGTTEAFRPDVLDGLGAWFNRAFQNARAVLAKGDTP